MVHASEKQASRSRGCITGLSQGTDLGNDSFLFGDGSSTLQRDKYQFNAQLLTVVWPDGSRPSLAGRQPTGSLPKGT